jgi:hypothetical protein
VVAALTELLALPQVHSSAADLREYSLHAVEGPGIGSANAMSEMIVHLAVNPTA